MAMFNSFLYVYQRVNAMNEFPLNPMVFAGFTIGMPGICQHPDQAFQTPDAVAVKCCPQGATVTYRGVVPSISSMCFDAMLNADYHLQYLRFI
jgi:hypothetical protein